MDEKQFDNKYGTDSSTEKRKSFHRSRRMFAIKENKLFIAPENVTYSHANWFELLGWINSEDDSLMNLLTRGYFDDTGIYFYRGYDFHIDEKAEKDMLGFISELVEKFSLSKNLHLFGGKIKQEIDGKWPPIKDYGPINDLL